MANTDSTLQIIPYYTQPHVHSVIRDNSQYDESVSVSTASATMPYATAIVVGADTGIDRTFVRLNDLKVKQAIFGNGNYDKYGQPSLQADVLFSGNNDVWLCRVLPDNATYANIITYAHFRKGKVLDELNQETGLVRLEIKFSTESVTKLNTKTGALTDNDIDEFARKKATGKADPLTGFITVPISYARITGRGQYGNQYGIAIARDVDSEKEYSTKMYRFRLIDNNGASYIKNEFSGSIVPNVHNSSSTLIDDVLGAYATGSCPISIVTYEDYIRQVYDFYQKEVVAANLKYLSKSGATADQIEELNTAQAITLAQFDPIFGYQLNTRNDDIIPYYCNYTMDSANPWQKPQLEVPNTSGATKPLNMRDWSAAYVGARVLVAADPLNGGHRWMYTVVSIDSNTGNIVYDEGTETSLDADQYDGEDLSISIGQQFDGGHDGDFQEITVNGVTRSPNASEMKLLLAKEYVKVFRGQVDRKILSPSKINLDFIFDANYNMTSDETIEIEDSNIPLYNSSTVLTDKDAAALSVLSTSNTISSTYTDLNVKGAMWDLNEFRCRNGMTINPEQGAGTLLMLDCGLVGLRTSDASQELKNIIDMMNEYTGRQTTIDLGYYDIVDPYTGKKVPVTVTYFIAQNYIKHIISNGLNVPFTYDAATIRSIQKDDSLTYSGDMVRDSFKPEIDLIDWDVKESLYRSRINYWTTEDEGTIVQRNCQNTRQLDPSALLEENNVRVLNTLKKNLEKANRGYLYKWNDPKVRKGFTDAQKLIYKPWIGTMVEDMDILFTANEWEQNRMIMHCYVDVKFRDIIKRIILEINISRPTYSES